MSLELFPRGREEVGVAWEAGDKTREEGAGGGGARAHWAAAQGGGGAVRGFPRRGMT